MSYLKLSQTIAASLLAIGLSTGSVWADMGTVINLAGKQRMLTQKMSKEALLVAKGIDAEANKTALQQTAVLFDKTLKGLKNGDAELNLPKTEDPAIVAQLDKVAALWNSFNQTVQSVIGGDVDVTVLKKIAAENLPLLQEMNAAVGMYEKAAGSALAPATATTLNLAGKQRMLTQKMTKELLLVANGIGVEENKAHLQKTVALFERTLKGLFEGDAELGLSGTQDAAIRAQLETVQKLWHEFKPVLDAVDVSVAGLNKAAQLSLPLLKEMNKAVELFEGVK